MASFNKITIVGYLGRDPEIRYMPDGSAVCNFSVATTEKRKDAAGEPRDITTWFRVIVWGRQGEAANQYLAKGSQVYVEGRLTQQEFTDRDGNHRTSLEVRANDVQFLSRAESRPDNDESASRTRAASASAYADDGERITKAEVRAAMQLQGADEDSIPF